MHNFLPPHSASLHLAFGYILWTFPCVNLINSFPRESFVLAFFEHFEHFWTFFNRMWEVSPLLLGSGRSDQLGREGCWAASEVCDPNNGAAGRWSRASLFGLWNSELGVWYVLICFDGFCSFFFPGRLYETMKDIKKYWIGTFEGPKCTEGSRTLPSDQKFTK